MVKAETANESLVAEESGKEGRGQTTRGLMEISESGWEAELRVRSQRLERAGDLFIAKDSRLKMMYG